MAAKALIDGLTTGSNTILIDNDGDGRQQQNTFWQSSSAIPTRYVSFSFTFSLLHIFLFFLFFFSFLFFHFVYFFCTFFLF